VLLQFNAGGKSNGMNQERERRIRRCNS